MIHLVLILAIFYCGVWFAVVYLLSSPHFHCHLYFTGLPQIITLTRYGVGGRDSVLLSPAYHPNNYRSDQRKLGLFPPLPLSLPVFYYLCVITFARGIKSPTLVQPELAPVVICTSMQPLFDSTFSPPTHTYTLRYVVQNSVYQ